MNDHSTSRDAFFIALEDIQARKCAEATVATILALDMETSRLRQQVNDLAIATTGDERLLDAAACALMLRVSRSAVIKLAAAGKIPGFRVNGDWRFDYKDVLATIKGQENIAVNESTTFGINWADKLERTTAQNGLCAICKEKKRLVQDHCHQTGNARDMLCGGCNSVLGFASDNPSILRAAADYLERHGK